MNLRVSTFGSKALFITGALAALFFLSSIQTAAAQTPGSFSTMWKTDNPGTSSSTAITIPTTGVGYDYTVTWFDLADASSTASFTNVTGDITLDFFAPGTYRVDITGDFPRIHFDNAGDRQKIISIEQWGDIAWTSMEDAFKGAGNLTYNASDAPDLSSVTNLDSMFERAVVFTGDLSSWDMSNVTDTTQMFQGATAFNGAVNGWGTTTQNITRMVGMFEDTENFNQPLDAWDVSSANEIFAMFSDAVAFNGSLNGWGASTTNITNMHRLFDGATSFNQPLDNWDVSSVTNMSQMFEEASSFNQDITAWDTSSVVDMRNMFNNATVFNQSLSTWDISGLSTTGGGFNDAFIGTAWDRDNYSAALQAWAALISTPLTITLRTDAQYTSSAQTARQTLIGSNSWTITDGGLYVPPVVGGSGGGGGATRICNPGNSVTKNCRDLRNKSTETDSVQVTIDREQLLVNIAKLQQQVAALQAQAELLATRTPGSKPVSTTCDLARDLTIGSAGEDVTCLQSYLTTTGDYAFPQGPTGYFGPVTQAAVQKWQTRSGILPAAGYFGSISRAALGTAS